MTNGEAMREAMAKWLGDRLRPGMDRYYQADQLLWAIKNEWMLAAPVQAEVGARRSDYFTENNANIRNAERFHEDVEFIHACHIEGGLEVACRQVFERREREAVERASKTWVPTDGYECHLCVAARRADGQR